MRIEYLKTCQCVYWKESKKPRGCFTAWISEKPKEGYTFCKALQEAGLGQSKEETLRFAREHEGQPAKKTS